MSTISSSRYFCQQGCGFDSYRRWRYLCPTNKKQNNQKHQYIKRTAVEHRLRIRQKQVGTHFASTELGLAVVSSKDMKVVNINFVKGLDREYKKDVDSHDA